MTVAAPSVFVARDDIYSYFEKQSKEINHTIPEYIKHLIEKNNILNTNSENKS